MIIASDYSLRYTNCKFYSPNNLAGAANVLPQGGGRSEDLAAR